MQIYCYEDRRSESLEQALRDGAPITALAVMFEVSGVDGWQLTHAGHGHVGYS